MQWQKLAPTSVLWSLSVLMCRTSAASWVTMKGPGPMSSTSLWRITALPGKTASLAWPSSSCGASWREGAAPAGTLCCATSTWTKQGWPSWGFFPKGPMMRWQKNLSDSNLRPDPLTKAPESSLRADAACQRQDPWPSVIDVRTMHACATLWECLTNSVSVFARTQVLYLQGYVQELSTFSTYFGLCKRSNCLNEVPKLQWRTNSLMWHLLKCWFCLFAFHPPLHQKHVPIMHLSFGFSHPPSLLKLPCGLLSTVLTKSKWTCVPPSPLPRMFRLIVLFPFYANSPLSLTSPKPFFYHNLLVQLLQERVCSFIIADTKKWFFAYKL